MKRDVVVEFLRCYGVPQEYPEQDLERLLRASIARAKHGIMHYYNVASESGWNPICGQRGQVGLTPIRTRVTCVRCLRKLGVTILTKKGKV